MIALLLRDVIERGISGDIAELGVYRGLTAKLIHHYAPEKTLHLFDTFSGFDARDVCGETKSERPGVSHFGDTNVEGVMRYISPVNENIHVRSRIFSG
jgi:O-methyltransferase